MTTPRRPSAAAQRRAEAAEAAAAPAPEAPADAAPPADAPAEESDATTGDGEAPGVIDRAKAAVGGAVDALLGGDDGDGDEADGPEEPSSEGDQTCVHPTCEDPAIPYPQKYFMATRGPAQGPMHHSCSHKTIPISR